MEELEEEEEIEEEEEGIGEFDDGRTGKLTLATLLQEGLVSTKSLLTLNNNSNIDWIDTTSVVLEIIIVKNIKAKVYY